MKMMRYIIGWSLTLSLFGGQGLSAQVREVVPGDTVRMTWEARAGEKKTFEFRGNEETAFIVDWGDGDTNVYVGRGAENLKASHTYGEAGTFDVRLYSEANRLEVVSWGLARYTERAFGMELEMVAVDGGTFEMGATSEQGSDADLSEKSVHSVALSSFYIGKYEVTQAQWEAVMGTTVNDMVWAKYSNKDYAYYGGGDNYPMYHVSWEEAVEFCKKLSKATGKTYRLPTEAEWEYAARGGRYNDGTKYAGSDILDEVAWYYGNSGYSTRPVGQKKANGLGLYDMSGNVREWCSDWYGWDYYRESPAINPQGPSEPPSVGESHVSRGGSCVDNHGPDSDYWTVWTRFEGFAPGRYQQCYGFRVVCVP